MSSSRREARERPSRTGGGYDSRDYREGERRGTSGGTSSRRDDRYREDSFSRSSRYSSSHTSPDYHSSSSYSSSTRKREQPQEGGLNLDEIMESEDKDTVAERLDEVMQKRREKVEKWRLARKQKQSGDPGAQQGSEGATGTSAQGGSGNPFSAALGAGSGHQSSGTTQPGRQATAPSSNQTSSSSWSLDKDDEDEEDARGDVGGGEGSRPQHQRPPGATGTTSGSSANGNGSNGSVGDDVDPLDAYMAEVTKEVRGASAAAGSSREAPRARVIVLNTASSTTVASFASSAQARAAMEVDENPPQAKKVAQQKGEVLGQVDDDHVPVADDFDIEQAASSLLAKGRQLPATDHSKVYYRPFRKDFYVEVPELARMTKQEVDDYRNELDEIKVRGRNCPKPLKNWAQCGVDLRIMNILKKCNYSRPTPIQAQAIPCIMSGRDMIGIAKTGSGKTLAFLLPMFRHVMDQPPLDEMDGPIALIMSPTRELALQTWKEANRFARMLNLRVVCVYGGVGISEQIADLKKGAEIIVCTPGRMIDMLAANSGRVTNLRRVTYLVLDEADRMFDMGFEPQVTKIVNNIRPDRQTVLFSATFPKQMEALARKALDKPIGIQVGGKSIVAKEVEQHALVIDEAQKFFKLLELLGQYQEEGNVLVFVEKQEKADDLVAQLMRSGYVNCAPLHGGIDQFDRDSTIVDFKMGKLKLMVATSVAARGLDVKKLILVVNYDCPNHYEDYVHRVGRTGRAGNKGVAYTFILPSGQEKMAGEVCRAFELAGVTPPEDVKQNWEQFREQMRAEGVEINIGGGGFFGSGFKYDTTEDEAEVNRRKMTKLVHGLETAVDDDDENIDEQLASMMKSKKRVVHGRPGKPAPKADAAAEIKIAAAKAIAEKIAAAKQLNQPVAIEKGATALTAEAIMKGGDAAPATFSATSLAKQKALELNERLNYLPSEMLLGEETEQQQQYFEEELEINDFPQQLRYRVCSRDAIAQVQEFADVGISVKGTHYPPGKEPREGGERKLYLFLEARDEISLKRAKDEVVRIMRETLRQMTASGQHKQPHGGRYKLF